MTVTKTYDLAVIGGGLAGLALSIQMAGLGFAVLLLEKEQYPFHKVCGEYISNESWPFLQKLGVPLHQMDVAQIHRLQVSAPNGKLLQAPLALGGFGISRYKLDALLAQIAIHHGVTLLQNCKVETVVEKEGVHYLQVRDNRVQKEFKARVCCGSWGKKSNLDVQFLRPFLQQTPSGLNNFIAVKYHVQAQAPQDTISLHNFENGYCGFSKIEGDRFCLCYLTRASNLRRHGNIAAMEAAVLHRNPHLKQLFTHAQVCPDFPITISNINFGNKEQVLPHLGALMGDAAGAITPLCGNGMSMALHSSKMIAALLPHFFSGCRSLDAVWADYCRQWKHQFAWRLRVGRVLQQAFGKERTTNLLIAGLQHGPAVVRQLIRATHGQPF